jgi:8-oxo-dGTP diphosphatase
MTAAEYRQKAESLLTSRPYRTTLDEGAIRQADVWARLAASAAISEQSTETAQAVSTDETIRYAADIVVVTGDGHLLLIERGWDPYEGAWALPGGHVDLGETSLEAAARELAEETGVRVDPADLDPIGVFDAPGRDPRGRYVSVAYLARVPAGTRAVARDDARRAEWFPLDKLPRDLAFDHSAVIDAARI